MGGRGGVLHPGGAVRPPARHPNAAELRPPGSGGLEEVEEGLISQSSQQPFEAGSAMALPLYSL